METMPPLRQELAPILIDLNVDDFQNMGMTPWFSYTMRLPIRPLPDLSDRPRIETERLIIRPIAADDLDAFHELRVTPELVLHSQTRGIPNEDKEETKAQIDAFAEESGSHWYFGAFLKSTGELIGEGGLPDCANMITSASGWPEAAIFIKPDHWRQGYGTEFLNAVMESWWDLPRERRRTQLIFPIPQGLEPGEEVVEGVVFRWEHSNEVAGLFFAKVLSQVPLSVEGGFESIDNRPGREGNLVRWLGTMIDNPRPREIEDEIEDEE